MKILGKAVNVIGFFLGAMATIAGVLLWIFQLWFFTKWLGFLGTILGFILVPGIVIFPGLYWAIEKSFPILYFAIWGIGIVFVILITVLAYIERKSNL